MFEQTLLTHPASARKTGAIAASFLAQTAIVGVLLVGPLLYTQALPMIPILVADVFTPPPLPPPPPLTRAVTTSGPSTNRSAPRMFVPIHIPKGPIRTTQIDDLPFIPTTEVAAAPGIVGVTVATNIPSLLAAPAVEIVKPAVTPAPVEAKPLRISGGVLAAKLVKQVVPQYPSMARQMRLSGSVHLLGIIAKDGRVQNLRVIDGHPLLRQAALDAVSQWVYSPTILNGKPVEVEAPIEVNFALR